MALVHGNKPIVTSGLVLCLDAANRKSYPTTGTTWTDLSGNGNTGTLNGTINGGVGYSGLNGGSLTFDGTDDYVQKTSATANLSAGVTMEVIFKSTDMTSRAQGLMSWNSAPPYINLWCQGDGKLRFECFGAYSTAATFSNNTWYHLVGTYKNGDLNLYVNGSNVIFNIPQGGTLSSSYTGNIIIGEFAGYLSGNIAKASIYNRALTATEIAQNYNALKGRYGLS
jgi:hypothetical protein